MSLFEALTKQAEARTFSDDELRNMSIAFRRYIATKNGSAIAVPAGFEAFLGGRQITDGDKLAAMRISSESRAKVVDYYRPEAYLNTAGGSLHYLPEVVKQTTLSGVTNERANAAIPCGFGVVEKNENVQALAAVAAQLISVKAGNWETNVPVNSWSKVLPKDGGMDATSLEDLATTFATALNLSPLWKAKDLIGKSACTGLEAMVFIRSQLDRLDPDEYLLINTRLVYLLLRPFEQEGKRWFYRVDEKGEEVVPSISYKEVSCSEKLMNALSREGFTKAFLYLGGYAPQLQLPVSTGRMKETLQRYAKMMELQIGNDSCTAILSGMRDFSGLNDIFGKRMQFTLAAAFSVMRMNRKLDIQLTTVGDIVMLQSSLGHIRKTHGVPLDVNYILPAAADLPKIPVALKSLCIYTPRNDSVIISVSSTSLPTSNEKAASVDYRSCSHDLIPSIWRNNDFIVWMPIYSDIYWSSVETDDTKLYASTTHTVKKIDKVHVYSFGTAAHFRGVVTTLDNFALTGFGYERKDRKWDMTVAEKVVHLPLVKYLSFPEWLKKVSADGAIQMVAWLRPVSRYSPISNLLYMSKAGVTLVLNSVEQEDGRIIGNYQRIESKSHRGREVGKSSSSNSSNSSNSFTRLKLPNDVSETISEISSKRRGKALQEEEQVESPSLTDPPPKDEVEEQDMLAVDLFDDVTDALSLEQIGLDDV
jgi:hypothetical protein